MKPNPSKKHTQKRSLKNATLTISLPKELKDEIEKMARNDRRTVSNYVVVELAKKLGITLSIILAFIHLTRSPSNWSLAALKKTGGAIVSTISNLAK